MKKNKKLIIASVCALALVGAIGISKGVVVPLIDPPWALILGL